MNKIKKLITVIMIAVCVVGILTPSTSAKSKKPLSPAFDVIAASNPMILSTGSGEAISFAKSEFKTALGTNPKSIVITSLPSISAGRLTLGSLTVTKGQKISSSSLSSLTFTPNIGTESAEFTFTVDGQYNYKTVMYFLDAKNYSPTSAGIDESFFKIKTYKNIAVRGTMRSADPEGDLVKYEIVSYPEKGLLSVKNKEDGEYTYTPMKNYVGRDSFSYVAVDKYGNRSEEITVDITVKRSESGIVFKDMIFDPGHYGAILLHSKGIMTGRTDDGEKVFMPDKEVSYGEFIKASMTAACVTLSKTAPQEIADDIMALPSEYRSYILTAYDLSLITDDDLKDLDCNKTLTKAEACVIIDALIGAEEPRTLPVFDDIAEVPNYALEAVCSLIEIGIIKTENGEISPTDILTRADCAEMLAEVINRK